MNTTPESNDSVSTLEDLKAEVQRFSDERDWRQFHAPKNLAMSLAIEAAELATNVRPERRGDYAVLKGADIPSLLIELGYLSSEADVARLTSEKWQQEASRAVRNGILQWFEEDRIIRDAMGK